MNYKKHLLFISILLTIHGCGGGGGGTTETTDDSTVNGDPTVNGDISGGNGEPSGEPYYKYAWHFDSQNSVSQGVESIVTGSDINILTAWQTSMGEGVKVAVIDDGFDINHEDLKENIAIVYNVDDDSNDVSNTNGDGTGMHGNTCAGFIVSPINGKGSLGSAPKSKLIGIKLISSEDAETIKAFEYAQQQGAKVINCSWGTSNVSQAVTAKLKEVYDAGITVVFASGNYANSLDEPNVNDESEVEWVIGVGASSEVNDVTTYSDYGSNIDVIAPGGDTELYLGILGLDDTGSFGDTNQKGLVSDSYAFTNGSSFAAPITTGVVALMYGVNPNITPAQVREILTTTADKVGGSNANYINGFDEKRAFGKINATKAVEAAQKL